MPSRLVFAANPAVPPGSVQPPGPRPALAVELSQAAVTFGHGPAAVPALSATTLRIPDGEFVALVGPSGCGKSTILRLVGGLVRPTAGVVIVGGREVASRALRVGMAFQNPTMLPWMTIEQNVMLPLKIVEPFRSEFRRQRRTGFRDKVHALLAQVGLEGFAARYPWQLSGGMLQRATCAAPWCTSRACCCWTSRSGRSTNSPARSCGPSCRSCGWTGAPPSCS